MGVCVCVTCSLLGALADKGADSLAWDNVPGYSATLGFSIDLCKIFGLPVCKLELGSALATTATHLLTAGASHNPSAPMCRDLLRPIIPRSGLAS